MKRENINKYVFVLVNIVVKPSMSVFQGVDGDKGDKGEPVSKTLFILELCILLRFNACNQLINSV